MPDGGTFVLRRAIPCAALGSLENEFAAGDSAFADTSGGGGGFSGSDDDSVESVLLSTCRTLENVPKEIRTLIVVQVASYLGPASGGIASFLGRGCEQLAPWMRRRR